VVSFIKKNKSIKKLKGQITIFMALSFLVVFTLFSMTVSLSMFIHDKINVQNATDLASYYVASKQAELLGAIAHNNYAIRQSFKLLSYRYRVYGNAARTGGQDSFPGNIAAWEADRNNRNIYLPSSDQPIGGGGIVPPRICIAAPFLFREVLDNNCQTVNFNLPLITGVGGAGIVGFISNPFNSGVEGVNAAILRNCINYGYFNWFFANSIVGAHKYEQRNRRHVINEIALNLAKPIVSGNDGMLDIEGGNIFEGAYKTFTHNLTESNREYIQGNRSLLTVENSMQGVSPSEWLSPIYINVLLPYSSFTGPNTNGCSESGLSHVTPVAGATQESQSTLDPDTQVGNFGGYLQTENDSNFEALTLGVEKNPWYMVYNKVNAFSYSKPLFLGEFISNQGIRVDGRSYAKPFGGRIGPWYNTLWSQGSNRSDGGDRTDPQTPERVELGQYGVNMDVNDPTIYPNSSRFPTDQNGLTTYEAMIHAGPVIGWRRSSPSPAGSLRDYAQDISQPIPQDVINKSFNRRLEIAAIVPDAFDVTYYSISPNYYDYFVEENGSQKLSSWITEPNNQELRGDIGAYEDNKNFSILDQMNNYNNNGANDQDYSIDDFPVNRDASQVPYFLNPSTTFAMLTSWNKGREPMSYLSPTDGAMNDFFARCETTTEPTGKPRQPSGCLQGGRFGYSVKLISSDYLQGEHPIGGNGTTGSLENGNL